MFQDHAGGGVFARRIRPDRGSDARLPGLGARKDDVRAVMGAAGSGRAVLVGLSEGAPMRILSAARGGRP